jgi:hypothetical protein
MMFVLEGSQELGDDMSVIKRITRVWCQQLIDYTRNLLQAKQHTLHCRLAGLNMAGMVRSCVLLLLPRS